MTIRIDGTNTAANPGITGSDTDTGLQFGTDEVNIVTGGSTRATVNSSGHLLVGGTTAGNAGTVTVNIGDPGATVGGLQLWATTTGSSFVQFGDATASASDHYRGLIGYEHNNDRMIFYTAGSERLRILSTGGLTFNGDTAVANALDDYEEGTWTPTEGNGVALTVAFASYTKIGRRVVCDVDLTYAVNSTGGYATISLPFAMENGGKYGSGIAGWSSNPDGVKVHLGANVAYWMKLETNSTNGNAHLAPANLSNRRILATFEYDAA